MASGLAGLTVINTRPAHQARSLSELISEAGGTVIEFPVIEIQTIDHADLQTQLSQLTEANIAIFISANAAEAGIAALGGPLNWPDSVAIAAVGQATAAKISSMGLDCSLVAPEPFNSEALLTLHEFQNLKGKSVIIFRGEGGREVLAETLRDRGAMVEYVECYRRIVPSSDPTDLYDCWDRKRVLLIVVTSNEGMENLYKLIEPKYRPDLLSSDLVVVSQRAINRAKELGFKNVPQVTANASNAAIMETIHHWYKQ